MPKRGKKYLEALKKVKDKVFKVDEACKAVKEVAYANFDETIEAHFNLGVDPRHADQQVRGVVTLPHGTGKEVKVVVICKPEKEEEAKQAGADYYGGEEIIRRIEKEGWLDFDVVIATPDMMRLVGRLGRILGPRGLMPNPKAGTVTFDIKEAVEAVKKGRIEFKVDKYGIIHVPIGKKSFDENKIKDNFLAVGNAIVRAKPAAAKGQYVKSVHLATTMSPSVEVDLNNFLKEQAEYKE